MRLVPILSCALLGAGCTPHDDASTTPTSSTSSSTPVTTATSSSAARSTTTTTSKSASSADASAGNTSAGNSGSVAPVAPGSASPATPTAVTNYQAPAAPSAPTTPSIDPNSGDGYGPGQMLPPFCERFPNDPSCLPPASQECAGFGCSPEQDAILSQNEGDATAKFWACMQAGGTQESCLQ